MRKTALATALLALSGQTKAQLSVSVCFTRPELRAGAALATGPVLGALADHCTRAFPQSSTRLTATRATVAHRFRAEGDRAAPVIAEKLAQAFGLGTGADPAAVAVAARALLPLALSGSLAKIDERACRLADAVVPAALAGSDTQVVDAVAGLLEFIATDPRPPARGRPATLRICDGGER